MQLALPRWPTHLRIGGSFPGLPVPGWQIKNVAVVKLCKTMPLEAANVIGALGGIAEIAREAFGGATSLDHRPHS